jgi:hypothetical protein
LDFDFHVKYDLFEDWWGSLLHLGLMIRSVERGPVDFVQRITEGWSNVHRFDKFLFSDYVFESIVVGDMLIVHWMLINIGW